MARGTNFVIAAAAVSCGVTAAASRVRALTAEVSRVRKKICAKIGLAFPSVWFGVRLFDLEI
jgi:hypothetical protein